MGHWAILGLMSFSLVMSSLHFRIRTYRSLDLLGFKHYALKYSFDILDIQF